jgi:phage baseplate assembly protein W
MATNLTTKNRVFSDLDMMFKAHPISGDIVKKYDENAVKQSIKNLVLTRPYESPFHPEISCQANNLLFELASPITAEIIKTTIIQVISKFEPRVSIFEVR